MPFGGYESVRESVPVNVPEGLPVPKVGQFLFPGRGGYLKRDSVTKQRLRGDPVVSKRDKGSPCHGSKRDKRVMPLCQLAGRYKIA